jgi:hypothetical protein
MLDTAGAADFAASQLQVLQRFPCINTTGVVTTPAFCTEFATPALCGSSTYIFKADGSNVPQCQASGSHMVLNVLNPGGTCVAGTPDPKYAADLTTWLQEQMGFVAGNRWRGTMVEAAQSDAKQQPVVSCCCCCCCC